VNRRAELPANLNRRTAYVVGDPLQWVMFQCPCLSGHDIALSLAPTGHWRMTTKRGRPTITPSVDAVTTDGRCHYWVRDGRVGWCADT
jgi:hypothetical protein